MYTVQIRMFALVMLHSCTRVALQLVVAFPVTVTCCVPA